jgi:hypothetical protein
MAKPNALLFPSSPLSNAHPDQTFVKTNQLVESSQPIRFHE